MRATLLRSALAATAIATLCALAPGDRLPSFAGATAWLNGPAVHAGDLKGKVVLVDVWEYTCINCLRTLPYLRAWNKRYASDGLEIVGVQTPEFGISAVPANVAAAVKRLDVTWPVAVDGHHTLWQRFGARAWPTEMLFDPNGHLVYEDVGEGNYQATELHIQALLHRLHPALSMPPPMPLLPQDSYDKPGAVCYPRTNEILIGDERIPGSSDFQNQFIEHNYHDPGNHVDGVVYLSGMWQRSRDAVIADGGIDTFSLRYHAIQVMVVMAPHGGGGARVDVMQDGSPVPKADAGPDVRYDAKGNSYVQVDTARAYDIIDNRAFGHHELRLLPESGEVGIYDVAFESCEVPGTQAR